jgi:hypothetical protein
MLSSLLRSLINPSPAISHSVNSLTRINERAFEPRAFRKDPQRLARWIVKRRMTSKVSAVTYRRSIARLNPVGNVVNPGPLLICSRYLRRV